MGYKRVGKVSDNALRILAKTSEGSVRDAVSLLDRALMSQSLDKNKILNDADIRKMLGLADRSKLINLTSDIFKGNKDEALGRLKELINDGLDPKNFLNDFLEMLYLFSRRITLGSFEKDAFISKGELDLIQKSSENLSIQDIGLFWQLTLKTIEDLKIVPNENIALEMFILQLIHIKELDEDDKEDEVIKQSSKNIDQQISKKKIEITNQDIDTSNFTKNQL